MPDANEYMKHWGDLAEKVGIPAALLFAMLLIGCVFMFLILRFLKPFVTKGFEKHFTLIDTLTEKLNEVPAMAKADTEGHDMTHGGLRALKEAHDNHHALTKEIHRKVVGP